MLGDCCPSLEICDCECHSFPGMKHCMPCCYQCPNCGKNIKPFYYDDHVKKCQSSNDQIIIESVSRLLFKEMARALELCRCHCHEAPGVKHIVACCLTCLYCQKRIRTLYYDEHIERCRTPTDCLTSQIEEENDSKARQLEEWKKNS